MSNAPEPVGELEPGVEYRFRLKPEGIWVEFTARLLTVRVVENGPPALILEPTAQSRIILEPFQPEHNALQVFEVPR